MSISLQRRCADFKRKLEQNLMIADTQISQLKEYYASVQSEIVEMKDRIARNENKRQQLIELKEGRKIKRQIEAKSRFVNLQEEHQATLAQIHKEEADEIEALQADFEENLKRIQDNDKKNIDDLEKQYNKKILEMEKQISKLEEDNRKLAEEEDNEEINNEDNENYILEERIAQLEEQINAKQEERANNLLLSKEKLTQCVNRIEDDEAEHKKNLEERKAKLQAIDEDFKEKVQVIKEDYKNTVPKLKKAIKVKQVEYKKLKQKMSETKMLHDSELSKLVSQSDNVKEELSHYQYTMRPSQMSSRIDSSIDIKLEELKRAVSEKENILLNEQNENNDLKRNISRLRFERRLAKKKQQLFK